MDLGPTDSPDVQLGGRRRRDLLVFCPVDISVGLCHRRRSNHPAGLGGATRERRLVVRRQRQSARPRHPNSLVDVAIKGLRVEYTADRNRTL